MRDGGRVRYGSRAVSRSRSIYGGRTCATPDPRPSSFVGRRWIPGRYEVRDQRVWIPASYERVWVEPEFGVRFDDCGLEVRFQISRGYWRKVHRPGHYEVRRQKVWVPGTWVSSGLRSVRRR